ncbi:hypothetical protein CVT24_006836, partial [Panaeolus cyanescens]
LVQTSSSLIKITSSHLIGLILSEFGNEAQDVWTADSFCSFLREYLSAKLKDQDDLCTVDLHNLGLLYSPHDNPNTSWLITIMPLFYSTDFAPSDPNPWAVYCDNPSPPLGYLTNNKALLLALSVIADIAKHQEALDQKFECVSFAVTFIPFPSNNQVDYSEHTAKFMLNVMVSLCANQSELWVALVSLDDFPRHYKRYLARYFSWIHVEGPPTPPSTTEVVDQDLDNFPNAQIEDSDVLEIRNMMQQDLDPQPGYVSPAKQFLEYFDPFTFVEVPRNSFIR